MAEVADRMFAAGTRNVVLMSGRGAPEAQRAEGLLADLAYTHDATWGAVRCAFLMQNFDEGFFAESSRWANLRFRLTWSENHSSMPRTWPMSPLP